MAGTFGFIVQVVDSETPSMMATKSVSITINAHLAVTTTSPLPDGTVGTAYSDTLTSSGGTAPVTWAVTTGTLPAPLTLNSTTGAISGTPTTAGSSTFTVTATDHLGQTASQSLSITIHPAPLSITTTTLPNGTINSPYNQTVSATGGTPPYTFSLASGSTLPPGLNLTTSNNQGVISGTPTTAGTFNFTVQVADSETPAATATKALSITINAVTACTRGQTTLCGRFTFGFQGTDANGPVAMAGSILTDGTNVVSGVIDINHVAPTTLGNFHFINGTINPSPASSFTFDVNKLGTLTLNISHGTLTLTRTFAVVMASDGSGGRLIGFDPMGTTGILGSGALGIADTTAFNQAAITDNYALAFTGGDGFPHRVGMLAIFAADGSCNFTTGTNGSVTINVGNTSSAGSPVTGLNFAAGCGTTGIDPTTGRGSVTLGITGTGTPSSFSIIHFALYVLNAHTLVFVGGSLEATPGSSEPVLAGFAVSQSVGPFSTASFTCGIAPNLPCVFAALGSADGGVTGASSAPSAAIGLITVTSPGMMSFLIDLNDGGTLFPSQTIPGFTFTVQPAGNGTITPPSSSIVTGNIAFVIIGPNTAFFLALGPEVNAGLLEPQLATSLNSANLNFAAVTQPPPVRSYGTAVALTTLTAGSGAGNASGVADANGGGPVSDAMFTASYEIASNGRATGTATLPGIATFTFYVVKGGRFVLMGQDPMKTAVLIEFGHRGGDILP
jgi:hypothetical protein